MPSQFVAVRDPQRPIWGVDWPYQLTPQIGAARNAGLPPGGKRIPVMVFDPQRPIWGLQWQYGFITRSNVAASAQALPGGPTPPPGSPYGSTGAAAPDLEAYGYYEPWRVPRPVTIAGLITPPAIPQPPTTPAAWTQALLRSQWTDATWDTQYPVKIATLQPPPPATNPAPQSQVVMFQIRLAWQEATWPTQTGGFIGDLPQPPPPLPVPPPVMPNIIGEQLQMGIQSLQQAGVLVPALLGYFSEYPISVVWVALPPPGIVEEDVQMSEVIFPSAPGPGLIIAQSIPAGAHAGVNQPIVLTVYEFPFSTVFP
jgi:hypothetical protein